MRPRLCPNTVGVPAGDDDDPQTFLDGVLDRVSIAGVEGAHRVDAGHEQVHGLSVNTPSTSNRKVSKAGQALLIGPWVIVPRGDVRA